MDGAATVWFTQQGRIYQAGADGSVSRIGDTVADSLLSFSAGGDSLAWQDYGNVYFVDSSHKVRVERATDLSSWWSEVAVSPSGETLAMAQQKGPVEVIKGEGSERMTPRPGAFYWDLQTSDDFVFAFSDDTVDVWAVDGQELGRTSLEGQGSAVVSASMGDEPLLAACQGGDPDTDNLDVIDVRTREVIDSVRLEFDSSPYADFFHDCQAVAMDASGDLVVAGSSAGEIRLWDRSTRQVIGERVAGTDERISAMSMDPDGTTLYVETSFEPIEAQDRWLGRRYIVPISREGR